MMKSETPQKTYSQQLKAFNGPINEIDLLQNELAILLFNTFKNKDLEINCIKELSEDEIRKICSLFTSLNRKIVSQRLLNAYCYNRYPVQKTSIPDDAPETTKEIANEK